MRPHRSISKWRCSRSINKPVFQVGHVQAVILSAEGIQRWKPEHQEELKASSEDGVWGEALGEEMLGLWELQVMILRRWCWFDCQHS